MSAELASNAEIERELGRRSRALAAQHNRRADLDDTPIGSIPRRAAALYVVDAMEHEGVALMRSNGKALRGDPVTR